MNCEACANIVGKTEKMECQMCNKTYHYSCLSIGRSDYARMVKLNRATISKCPICKSHEPKTDNFSTPVRDGFKDYTSPIDSPAFDKNYINHIFKKEMKEMRDLIQQQLTSFMTDFKKEISDKLTNLITTTDTLTSELDKLKCRLKDADSVLTTVKSLENEVITCRTRISNLESECNRHQQWLRKDNVELQGVPELKNESPTDIIIKVAKHVGVDLKPENIKFAHRVQPPKSVSGRCKNIVAQLDDPLWKNKLIVAVRKSRGVTTSDIEIPGKSCRIFVNEHLTAHNKNILKLCKEKCKLKGYKYTWVKNCTIYVRKNDNSNFFHIKSELDLEKIV